MRRLPPALLTSVKFSIALLLLGYLVASGAIDWNSLQRFASMWNLALGALFLLSGAVVINALRLYVLFQAPGLALSFSSSLRLTLIGLFFNACLPGASGGDLIRMYYASSGNAGRRVETVAVIVLDRIIGLVALMLVPLVVVITLNGVNSSLAFIQQIAFGAAAASLGMLACLTLSFKILPLSKSLPFPILNRFRLDTLLGRMNTFCRAYGDKPGVILAAVAISLASHGLTILATLLIAQAMNRNGLSLSTLVLIPIGFVANAVPLTPGGLGIGEVAFSRLFALAGSSGGAETLLGWRLLTIILGLVGLVLYLNGRKQLQVELKPSIQTEAKVL